MKCELISIGSIPGIDLFARELGCKVGSLPSAYLGLPLGARHRSVVAWDRVEVRFRKRLGLWKCQYISKGRRTTLVRSALSNLPIYFMYIFQMPKTVKYMLDQLQRSFLWRGARLDKKPHLVNWATVCLEKESGG